MGSAPDATDRRPNAPCQLLAGRLTLATLLAVLWTPGAPAQPVDPADTNIRQVVHLYWRAIESRDVELLKRVRPGLTVPEALRIEQAFAQQTFQTQLDGTVHDVTLSVSGDEGVASVTVRTLTRYKAFSGVIVDRSKGLITLRRGPAGWFITAIDMHCVEGCWHHP